MTPEASHPELTHQDSEGKARMVDVSEKLDTVRAATAVGRVVMKPATFQALTEGRTRKGDPLSVAQIAGIMAAKKTPELIPLCHPLLLTDVSVQLEPDEEDNSVKITAEVKVTGKTGVEMEALTAVAVSALALYDMLKAVDKEIRIEDIHLVRKSGGKSGTIELG
ncbi:MAG: cyclic pyranopterin monophosphate synthase MoaC [Dehalococcoidia bacterium]|nr:cyclic pyranopterin monophosphate synthase MoaC [Dehalococcoidia bacterium]